MKAVSCVSADLSRVNCLVVQRLAASVVQLSDTDYQLLVSSDFTVNTLVLCTLCVCNISFCIS